MLKPRSLCFHKTDGLHTKAVIYSFLKVLACGIKPAIYPLWNGIVKRTKPYSREEDRGQGIP